MALYNEVNAVVLERSNALPAGCEFEPDTVSNFDDESSISQWSAEFAVGHDWLSEVWEEYMPDFMDEEYSATAMVLTFFSSRQLAEVYYADTSAGVTRKCWKS